MTIEILQKIKSKIHELTSSSGVYKMLDENGNIIYVGKAKNLKRRVSSYFLNTQKPNKVMQMVENVFDFEYVVTPSEREALSLESNLIHKFQPYYNILLKDGKAFPYIKVDTKKSYPIVEITRRIKKDNSLYFGPFFANLNATDIMKVIENAFKLRKCNGIIKNKKSRACLNYQMGKCFAPCQYEVSKDKYDNELKKVIDFLKGDTAQAKEIIENKMKNFASNQLFEKALEYRELVKKLDKMDTHLITHITKFVNMDIFGFYSNNAFSTMSVLIVRGGKMVGSSNYNLIDASLEQNEIITNFITQYYMQQKVFPDKIICSIDDTITLSEWVKENSGALVEVINPQKSTNKKLLDMAEKNAKEYLERSIEKQNLNELKTAGAIRHLREVLKLKNIPHRIEGFDISNLSGTDTVASMVVFENGIPNKKHYRKFKIDRVGQNDFDSMKQVLTRRINELNGKDLSFSKRPDLILIDGGSIQLSFANSVLIEKDLDIDIISLAKREEEIYTPECDSTIKLSRDDYGLKLLQNVRDESHRFAITFQRQSRKNNYVSKLNEIKLLGKEKQNALLEHFGTYEKIKNAEISKLEEVNGIGKTLAKNIYEYFHK